MSRTTRGKTILSVFFKKASPAGPSQEHGSCPPLGFQPPFLLNIAGGRPAMFDKWGVFRACVLEGFQGVVVGFNFGFDRTKTTQLTLSKFGSK